MTISRTTADSSGLSSSIVSEFIIDLLNRFSTRSRVLIIPPDITRIHSQAGKITKIAYDYYKEAIKGILPAIGTHIPMTPSELDEMFPGVPPELFITHNWKRDVKTLGYIGSRTIQELSGGKLSYRFPVQMNNIIQDGGFDLILSIGQVVPHEVVGMANHTKNIFVGTGGAEAIHKSHFLGAVTGTESIMGRVDTSVRALFDIGWKTYAKDLPMLFIQTVIAPDGQGTPRIRGVFAGDDRACFEQAAELSARLNITKVKKPLRKVVVYLDPHEYRSTWLGNKSIYRTRKAIASGGELIILGPNISQFGEDPEIDGLIRIYGYVGTDTILQYMKHHEDLGNNLATAAHLIHGSSEGRFKIRYCPGYLTEEEITKAGFLYGDLKEYLKKYDPKTLHNGYNTVDDEEIYYISNPGLGLWALDSDQF